MVDVAPADCVEHSLRAQGNLEMNLINMDEQKSQIYLGSLPRGLYGLHAHIAMC